MRSKGAAHGVEVDGHARRDNDRLRVQVRIPAGRPVDDEDADKEDDGSHHAGLRTIFTSCYPGRTDGVALNNRRELGDATYGQSKQEAHAGVPGKVPTPGDPERAGP